MIRNLQIRLNEHKLNNNNKSNNQPVREYVESKICGFDIKNGKKNHVVGFTFVDRERLTGSFDIYSNKQYAIQT